MAAIRHRRVALPETRHLDILAGLLERRGIQVVRCPMVSIHDAPDQSPIVAWIERLCVGAMNLLIVYTGEGVERLEAAATRAGCADRFAGALQSTRLLTRGPKPARALRRFSVVPKYRAKAPTTAGIMQTLDSIDIRNQRVGVQLYGKEPLPELIAYLEARRAIPDPVAPYIYADESDDHAVRALIAQIKNGEVGAIAFTSQSQVRRLARLAQDAAPGGLAALLAPLVVAAVGPVAARALECSGVRVDIVPESVFFMKPMVTALTIRLGAEIRRP